MRVNTRVGTLPPGHVFVTPLTRRAGCVAPVSEQLQVAGAEERRFTQEVLGVTVELSVPPPVDGMRKALHPDVLVEVAVDVAE